jgi:hypothetical protein
MIPSTIRFVAFDAIPNHFQISIADCDSCVQFDCWQQLRKSGIAVDFRRVLRIDSEFHGQNDYQINLSAFEERSVLDELDGNLSAIHERNEDGSLVIANSKSGIESKESFPLRRVCRWDCWQLKKINGTTAIQYIIQINDQRTNDWVGRTMLFSLNI